MRLKLYFLCFVTLLCGISYYTFQHIEISTEFLGEEEEEGLSKQERIDQYFEMEFEMTKDPATNTVPKERLKEARKIAKQRLAQNRNAGLNIQWEERGPNNIGGRTRAILIDAADPTYETVFAGSVSGGLWKTTNISAAEPNWTPINDLMENLAIGCITQDPNNPSIIYFGTGETTPNWDAARGFGIWKSTNGGASFTHLQSTINNEFNYVNKILVVGNVVLAGTDYGIYRSTDGGASWTNVKNGFCSDLELSPDGSIYASRGVVFKSYDQGLTWITSSTFSSTRIDVAICASNPNRVYALTESSGQWLKRSYDAGATWETASSSSLCGNQCWYDIALGVDPNNPDRIFLGGINMAHSFDAGETINYLSNIHADQHTVVFQPGNSNVVLFGNDGGVYRTTNGASSNPTIDFKSYNYNVTQFYACALHPGAGVDEFLGGTQDNGTLQYNTSGINAVNKVMGGDGAFCHIDQNNPNIQIGSYQNNYGILTTDSWNTTIGLSMAGGSFINPTDYDSDTKTLYALRYNTSYTYVTDIGGLNTQNYNITPNLGPLRCIIVSPNIPNRIYIGSLYNSILIVDNANTSNPIYTEVYNNQGSYGNISSIAIQKGNENHIVYTVSNYGAPSVWESTDAGTNWTLIEGDLPDMPVRWGMFAPNNPDQFLLATELGVWSTNNIDGTNTQWEPTNDGLANTRVTMFQHRESDNKIIASSYGRGIFSTDHFLTDSPFNCLSTNSTFTNGLTGWNNWGNTVATSVNGYDDCCAAKIGSGEGGFGSAVTYPATVGTSYTVGAFCKITGAPDFAGGGIKFLDVNGTELFEDRFTVTSTEYEYYQVTATAPAGTTQMYPWAYKTSNNGNLFVDNLCIGETVIDDNPPTAVLSTANNIVNGSFIVDIAFSEDVTGLSLADFTYDNNSTISNLTGSGRNYSLTVNPTTEGGLSITLLQNTVTDAAGNLNPVSNTLNINYVILENTDCLVENSSFQNGLTSWNNFGNTQILTTGGVGDCCAANIGPDEGGFGQAGYLSAYPGQVFKLTAWCRSEGAPGFAGVGIKFLDNNGIQLAEDRDSVSSNNFYKYEVIMVATTGATNLYAWAYKTDTVGVLVVDDFCLEDITNQYVRPIGTLSTPIEQIEGPVTININFNENVTGLSLSDFVVNNANISNLTGSGSIYALTLTPTGAGNISIQLPQDAVLNAASYYNVASNILYLEYEGCLNANTSFQSGSNGWFNYGNTTFGYAANSGYDDDYSAQVGPNEGGFGQSVTNPANPADVFVVSAYAKTTETDISVFGIQYLNSSNAVILENRVFVTSANYQYYEVQETAPSGTTQVIAWAYKLGNNGVLTLDNLCLRTTGEQDYCYSPIPSDIEFISGNCVKLNWDNVPDFDKYKVRYRLQNSGDAWEEVNATLNYRFLNGLTPNSKYEYRVKTVCTSKSSTWSDIRTFQTSGDQCDLINASNVILTSITQAVVHWSSKPDDVKYKIKYKAVGDPWTEVFINQNSYIITGLVTNTTYKYKLKPKCIGGWANWSQKYSFNTPSSFVFDGNEDQNDASLALHNGIRSINQNNNVNLGINTNKTLLDFYPNPAKNHLNLSVFAPKENASLIIQDTNGKIWYQKNIYITDNITTKKVSINDLPTGIYFVSLLVDGVAVAHKKLLKY